VGVVQTSLEGELLKVNAAFCTMLGYSAAELEGRKFREITHPDDLTSSEALKDLLASRTTGAAIQKRYVRKDGGNVWCNVSVSPICGAQGKPEYFVAVV